MNKRQNKKRNRVCSSCKKKKTLREKYSGTLFDKNCSSIAFNSSLRIMEIKTKINKWDLIKLKSFCTAKDTINKMKRQPTEWEKIFAKDVN